MAESPFDQPGTSFRMPGESSANIKIQPESSYGQAGDSLGEDTITIKTEIEDEYDEEEEEEDDDDFESSGQDCFSVKQEYEAEEFNYLLTPKLPKKQKHENLLCPICGKIFARKPYLDKHILTVHEGAKMFKCDECGRSFGQKGTLKLHKKCVHDKNREFICAVCSKDFTYKQSLMFHTKTVHDKIKDLECNQCHKMFGLPNQLKIHIKTVHEKIKDHVCTICGKAFGCHSTFGKHMKRVHENFQDPRAKCPLCSLQLSRKCHLVRHLQNVHKITNP